MYRRHTIERELSVECGKMNVNVFIFRSHSEVDIVETEPESQEHEKL